MTKSQGIFIAFGILFFLFIGCAMYFNGNYNLNKIKSKTVGDGQYGTARFATDKEVHQSLKYIEFDSVNWRKGIDLPKSQGLVVGSKINFGKTFATMNHPLNITQEMDEEIEKGIFYCARKFELSEDRSAIDYFLQKTK